jgi:O-antigen ligase
LWDNTESPLKFVFLPIGLIGTVILSNWLRQNSRHALKVWVLVGFLPFGITAFPHFYVALISWSMWPGFAKGAEISLLDLVLLALYLGMPRSQTNLPFKASMSFYLFFVVISVVQADTPVASFFSIWQLARMFFAYMVVARACEDERVVKSLLTGMVVGLGYEVCIVCWQRFVLGEVQTPGTFGHQNTLGMISHFAAFPLCALFLAGEKGWQPLAAPAAGIVVAVLTVSRATIGLAGCGYVLLFMLSALRKFTPRLAMIALVAIVAISAVSPFVISSFQKRFAEEPDTGSYDERAAFEHAAEMMLSDHPLGVGANNFVIVANTKGYFDAAGVAATNSSRSAHVHNAYLLAAAETGYVGGVAFVLMLLQPLILALRVGWRSKNDKRGDLLLGFAVALLLVYLQSFYEWTFFLFYPQYMFVLTIGMVAGLAQQLSYRRRLVVRTGQDIRGLADSLPGSNVTTK